jgi:aminopeptidase YwaD
MTTQKVIDHVRVLSVDIGSRMIGTPGNQAAGEYVTSVFRSAGLSVEALPDPCPSWVEESTCLNLAGHPVEAYANTFSPSCDVSAPVIAAGSLMELETLDMAGKVVVLYGELTQAPLSAKAFFFAAERDLRVIALLEERQPAAVITVNPVLGMRWRLIEDPDFTLPSATVSLAAGLDLVRSVGETAQLKIVSRRKEGSTDNIVARLAGDGTSPYRIVLCAHYDSKPDTPGAVDNACGTAVLLGLASRLAQRPHHTTLELAAFTREEFYVSPKQDVYFEKYGSSFGDITAAINFDGLGGALSATNMAVFSASAEFEALAEAQRLCYPGVIRAEPWPASSHFLFFSNGVATLAFSSAGPNGLIHTPHDSFENVSEAKLEQAVSLAAGLVQLLDDKTPAWSRGG